MSICADMCLFVCECKLGVMYVSVCVCVYVCECVCASVC